MTLIDDPEHLRIRAAEMRRRADDASFPETKKGLSRIADDYDLLATRAEQRLAAATKPADGHNLLANADAAVDQKPTISEVNP